MSAQIAIVGAGYVGLPLAVAFAEAGREVVCLDTDQALVAAMNRGLSHVEDVADQSLAGLVGEGRLRASTDPAVCAEADAVLLCLPTPLSTNREPDLSILEAATRTLADHVRPGQLIILESTTYPGTTREVLAPILEQGGLVAGRDFHLAISPERIDPGRRDWTVKTTPKVVGGLTPACTERAIELYSAFVERLVPVSSCEAAELTKLLENIFRSVNIALVNELAMLCHRMGLDVWEVVDAAATKPYGFMPFTPGPGLGGHCLPIDPFYLSWKAREYDFPVEFIELAGKVNQHMPYYCAERVAQRTQRSRQGGAWQLTADSRRVLQEQRRRPARVAGAEADRASPRGRCGRQLPRPARAKPGVGAIDLASVELTDEALRRADAVCVVTAHAAVDHARVAEQARLVVDFRNAVPNRNGKVVVL